MIECVIREAKEELDIDILENDCEVVYILHRILPQNRWADLRVYFEFM